MDGCNGDICIGGNYSNNSVSVSSGNSNRSSYDISSANQTNNSSNNHSENVKPVYSGNVKSNGYSYNDQFYIDQKIRDIAAHPVIIPDTTAINDTLMKEWESLKALGSELSARAKLDKFKMGLLIALGILLLPEAVTATAGTILTALAIGPVAEIGAVEVLGNAAFVQAATRAGAIVCSGKALNLFGVFKPAPIIEPAKVSPYLGWTAQQVIAHAKQLGLGTPRNRLLLWTGFKEQGPMVSKEFAERNGYITLEMTPGGKWLSELGLSTENSPIEHKYIAEIWDEASRELVRNASGVVHAITGRWNPNAVYNIELQEIAKNENIIGFDPLQLIPKYGA